MTLCAVNMAEELALPPSQVACYTFGCPRIGNGAYKAYAAQKVPDTWHVVNSQDVVTKMLGGGWMYRRCARVRIVK